MSCVWCVVTGGGWWCRAASRMTDRCFRDSTLRRYPIGNIVFFVRCTDYGFSKLRSKRQGPSEARRALPSFGGPPAVESTPLHMVRGVTRSVLRLLPRANQTHSQTMWKWLQGAAWGRGALKPTHLASRLSKLHLHAISRASVRVSEGTEPRKGRMTKHITCHGSRDRRNRVAAGLLRRGS
jgi:hypothetical protein